MILCVHLHIYANKYHYFKLMSISSIHFMINMWPLQLNNLPNYTQLKEIMIGYGCFSQSKAICTKLWSNQTIYHLT